MFEAFVAWLKLTVLESTYTYSRGMWVETKELEARHIAAILRSGGAPVDVDDRHQRFRVILLGPRNDRSAAVEIDARMEAIVKATIDNAAPCGATHVRAIGEPVGAGYTTENRAWYSLDLEVIF